MAKGASSADSSTISSPNPSTPKWYSIPSDGAHARRSTYCAPPRPLSNMAHAAAATASESRLAPKAILRDCQNGKDRNGIHPHPQISAKANTLNATPAIRI